MTPSCGLLLVCVLSKHLILPIIIHYFNYLLIPLYHSLAELCEYQDRACHVNHFIPILKLFQAQC